MLKKFLQITFILNLVLLLIFFGNEENALWDVEEIDAASFAVEDEYWELTGDDEMVFTFENQYAQLDNLLMRFTGTEACEIGMLRVEITRFGASYYYYELPVEYYNEDFLYLYINGLEDLKWHRNYELKISVEGLGENKIYLSGCSDMPVSFKDVEGCNPVMGVQGIRRQWDGDAIGRCLGWLIMLNLVLVMLWVIIRLAGKAVYLHAGCFLLGVALVLGLLIFFEEDELVQSNKTEYWASTFVQQITHIPLKDRVVEQTFTAQHDYADGIYIFFDNQTSVDEGTVYVDLEDDKGKKISGWKAPVSKLGDDTFCLVFKPEKTLKKNAEYTIKVYMEGMDSDVTIRVIDDRAFHKSVGELRVDGEVYSKAALYFIQGYQVRYSFWTIAACAIMIAFLCYLLCNLCPIVRKYLRWALTCLIPVVAFAGIELLSGNMGLTKASDVGKNIVLIAALLLFLRGVLGKFADYLVMVLAFVVGTVNYYVLHTRGTDFLFTDIRSAGTAMTVAGNYELAVTAPVYLAGTVTIIMLLMAIYLDRKNGMKVKLPERLITAGIGGAVALWMFVFVLPKDNISLWDISGSLGEKGWFYGNFCLLQAGSVNKPEGYSKQEIQAVLEEYDTPMEQEKEIVPENLIVIMNEALSDLQILGDLETSDDSLSFIRSLSDNTIKGNLHVPTLGGNTCNTEYEFLTGNSLHFITSAVVPYMVLCEEKEPGINSILRAQGYHTVAMHPYIGENWNRDKVYEAMEFDAYLDVDDFPDAERIRNFVSDKGDYDRIIEYYESLDKDEKLFVFNVTMQNHGGYDVNTGYVEKTVTIDNVDCELAENYLSLVKESDEAFAYLIDYFSNIDEPTMIVMFGDHQPSFPDDFYEQLNDVSVSGKNTEGDNERFLYITPYIVWTNYESNFEEIPDMSSNYLSSYVLQCAGVELSEYQEFLLQFMEKYPVIGKYGIIDANGGYTKYGGETTEWLKEYEYLQYLRIKDRKSEYYSIFSESYE